MSLAVVAPGIRILLLTAFLLLAKMGWFTWLTPENAHGVVNSLMDALVAIVPIAYAAWAVFKSTREQLIKSVKARSGVIGVAVTPELDAKIDDPAVATPKKLVAAQAAGEI